MTQSIFKAKLMIFGLVIAASTSATEASALQFETAYTDRSGLSWSKILPENYSNGCVDSNGNYDRTKCSVEAAADGSFQVKVDDSNAAKACRDIGARLPTKSEIESLIRDFGHNVGSDGPTLTFAGRTDMETKFGVNRSFWFWSSSVLSDLRDNAWGFDGSYGNVGFDDRELGVNAVRCVSGR